LPSGIGCRFYFARNNFAMMRRTHAMEIARYYQRLENIEKRKKEAEEAKKKKKNILRRIFNV
jgi:hypothetical protein